MVYGVIYVKKLLSVIAMRILTLFISIFLPNLIRADLSNSLEEGNDSSRYTIEGRVFPLSDYQTSQTNWQTSTRILVNGGEYIGFVRKDGSFYVNNVPSGSYVLDILNPDYTFEPVRVEINSKGKFRARKVNFIQSTVVQLPYPLRVKALSKTR